MLTPLSLLRVLAFAIAALAGFSVVSAKPITPAGSWTPSFSTQTPAAALPDSTGALTALTNTVEFDTTFIPLPPNVASLNYENTATAEFGDHIRFSATASHTIDRVTVTLSSGAIRSDYPEAAAEGFQHPITLNLYEVDRTGVTPQAGRLLATMTTNAMVPWRPEPDDSIASPLRPWKAADGNYYIGIAFTLTFDLADAAVSLPDEVIYGISFNTQHYGPAPIGQPGPWNSLGLGVNAFSPEAGMDLEADAVFWKTVNPAFYADGGAEGSDLLRHDTDWLPYKPAVRFNSSAFSTIDGAFNLLRSLRSSDRKVEAALGQATLLTSLALASELWDGENYLQGRWGRVCFELLAEAADELLPIANGRSTVAPSAHQAIRRLLIAAETLAVAELADAIAEDHSVREIVRAEQALAEAAAHEKRVRYGRAIEAYGDAWREAILAGGLE